MKFLILLTALCFASFAHAEETEAREVQNGGGGVVVNGRYLTYYSAKGMLRQEVEPSQEVPGLDLLVREVMSLPMLPQQKSEILNVIDASRTRRYFRVSAETLNPVMREEIIAKYVEETGYPKEDIVIFALTDVKARTTVLLPEFYSLRPSEQVALLMHEALWLLPKQLQYGDVIEREQLTQAYFEDKANPEKFYRFLQLLEEISRGDSQFKIKAGLAFDLRYNRLPENQMKTKRILLRDLLGNNFVRTLFCSPGIYNPISKKEALSELASEAFYNLRFNYDGKKSSLFFQALSDYLQEGNVLDLDVYTADERCQSPQWLADLAPNVYLDLNPTPNTFYFKMNLFSADGQSLPSLIFYYFNAYNGTGKLTPRP